MDEGELLELVQDEIQLEVAVLDEKLREMVVLDEKLREMVVLDEKQLDSLGRLERLENMEYVVKLGDSQNQT